jgi:tetraacyldisaccharide 4'-kinase
LRLDAAVTSAWQRRGLLAWVLSPLALLYGALVKLRRAAYRSGLLRSQRIGVPVVVIGNLYVGGTGKTPLTIALVRALQARGLRPGVVSHGYGGARSEPRLIGPDDAAEEVGDEPLLIARATRTPVAVGANRTAATRALLQAHPGCDLVVADDGLQHLRLARDFEIALLDERGFGNGWVLPAGPLREPPARLASVDAIVLHGRTASPSDRVPNFALHTRLGDRIHRLAEPMDTMSLAELAKRQRESALRVIAAAGIGVPERFFRMLRREGIAIDTLALADHYDYRVNPFAAVQAAFVLITENDAVKCAGIEALRSDPRIWVVPLSATIDEALVGLIITRLNLLRENMDGSPAA